MPEEPAPSDDERHELDELDELDELAPVDDADRPGFQPGTGQLPSVIKRTRARYGGAGAGLAAAMLAVRDILEKPKDEIAVVVDAPSDPVDLDNDGVVVPLDEGVIAQAPPQARPPVDPSVARAWVSRQIRRRR